jgi:tRNA 2-thiouridine synthesizing protein A
MREIDTRGLRCPLPVLRAGRALREMPNGALLRVLCDDPAAPAEFAAFCEATGATLVESAATGDAWVFLIRRAG